LWVATAWYQVKKLGRMKNGNTKWIWIPRENENHPDGHSFFHEFVSKSRGDKRQQNFSVLTLREFLPYALSIYFLTRGWIGIVSRLI